MITMKRQSRGTQSPTPDKTNKRMRTRSSDVDHNNDVDDDPILLTLQTQYVKTALHGCEKEATDKEVSPTAKMFQGLLEAAEKACREYLSTGGEVKTEPEEWTHRENVNEHCLLLSERMVPMLVSLQTNREKWTIPVYFRPLWDLLWIYHTSRTSLDGLLTSAKSKNLSFTVRYALNALQNHTYGLVFGLPSLRDVFQVCFRPVEAREDGSDRTTFLTCTKIKTCSDCDSIFHRRETRHSDIMNAVVTGATILVSASTLRTWDEVQKLMNSPDSSLSRGNSMNLSFLEATLKLGEDTDSLELDLVPSSGGRWYPVEDLDSLEHSLFIPNDPRAASDEFKEALKWVTAQSEKISEIQSHYTTELGEISVISERLKKATDALAYLKLHA